MVTKVWCNYNAVSQKERARAILFGNAKPEDFIPTFMFDGIQYYKKNKIKRRRGII